MPSLVLGDSWPGTSYVLQDVTTQAPVIVNVTEAGHPLFPGIIARYVSGTPGNYTVNNVGEGTAMSESSLNLLAKSLYNEAWQKQTDSILNNISSPPDVAAGGGGYGGFLIYHNKANNNQMRSVYLK